MAAVKKSKGRSAQKRRAKESATWDEHNDRVRYQAALSTERFLQEHRERIGDSPAESIARNSYLAGMIDMLSTARGTFGFWGADKILDELERVNRRFARADERPRPEHGAAEDADDGPPGVPGAPEPGQPTIASATAKASRVQRRDPMYA